MLSGPVSSVITLGLALSSYWFFLRYLGYESLGLWFALSSVYSLAQIGNLGVNSAVSKLIAEDYAQQRTDTIVGTLSTAAALLALSGLVLIVVAFVCQSFAVRLFGLWGEQAASMKRLFPFMAILSVYVFVVDAFSSALAGLGRIDLANYSQIASQTVSLVVSVTLLRLGFGLPGLMVASATAVLLLHALVFRHVWRILGVFPLRLHAVELGYAKRLLSIGGWMLGWSVINLLLMPINRIFLSRYAGLAALTVFELSWNAALRFRNLFESAFRAVLPETSRLMTNADAQTGVAQIRRRCWKTFGMIALPAYGFALLATGVALPILLRSRMNPLLPGAMRLMLASTLVSLAGTPSYYILLGLGKASSCFHSGFIQAVVNALLLSACAGLFSRIGIDTACLTTLAGMTLSTLFLIRQDLKTSSGIGG